MSVDVERVLRLRSAGFTVREIADLVGCSRARVGQIVKAQTTEPPQFTIQASKGKVTVTTDSDAQVAGAAVKRALQRAGWRESA